MATLVLGAIGNSAFGYIGALAGTLIGSVIDQKLFGADVTRPEGPDGLQTGRDEGVPVSWGSGQEVVSDGMLTWASPLRKVEDSEKGKGGGKKETTTISYKADVAVTFMKRETDSLRQLWLGGDLLYDADADVALAGTTVSVAAVTPVYTPNFSGGPTIKHHEIRYQSTSGGVDLSELVAGYDVVVTGFTDSGNNGTRRVVSSWKNVDGTTVCIVFDPNTTPPSVPATTDASTESAGDSVTFAQDLPEFSPARLGSVTYFNGSSTQVASSVIEAVEGAGNVPAWRGWSWVLLGSLDVTKWGGSFPEVRAVIRENASGDLATIVSDVVLRSGKMSASDLDVTALAGVACKGITSSGPQSARTMLVQLAITHNLEVQERDGKLVFFQAENGAVVPVPESDWGAVNEGRTGMSRMPRKTVPRQRLAESVTLTFFDPERDYNPGSVSFGLLSAPVERGSKIPLDLTLSRLEALEAVKRLALRGLLASEEFEVSLPPEYVHVLEGDVLAAAEGSQTIYIRAERVDRGENGLVIVEGPRESLASLSQDVDVEEITSALSQTSELVLPKEVLWGVYNLPPLVDSHATQVGVYVFMGASSPGDAFTGGIVFESLDGGTDFTGFQTIVLGSLYGRVVGTLGDGDAHFLDTENTLTVELMSSSATLSSATAEAVLSGANQILVGEELVGYTTATLVSGVTYALTGLLRGMKGTHDKTTGHNAGELAVKVSLPTFKEVGVSGLNREGIYVGVPSGGSTDDYSSTEQSLTGETARPLDVYNVEGSRDGSNNLSVSWSRRTRVSYAVLTSALSPPQVEASIAYQVDVLDSGVVVRTIAVTTEAASYTAAEQTADGLTPGDPIDLVIYQMGALVGRGRAKAATV
jgi:hypothetical protein